MADMEQLYDALRAADAAGDTKGAQRLAEYIQEQQGSGMTAALARLDKSGNQPTTEDQLRADPDWINASSILYKMNTGTDFPAGTADADKANYGLDEMGWFNNNLAQMGMKVHSLLGAQDEQKRAFLYLMDRSENLGWSWEGTGRVARGIATDPTTYVGLVGAVPTFGGDEAVITGGAAATRFAAKKMLQSAINAGTRAAVDGFVYGAARDAGQQTVRIQGGAQQGYDWGEMGTNAAITAGASAVLGGVAGGAFDAGAQALKLRAANKAAQDASEFFKAEPGAEATATPEATEAATPPTSSSAPVDLSMSPPANENPPLRVEVTGANEMDGPELPAGAKPEDPSVPPVTNADDDLAKPNTNPTTDPLPDEIPQSVKTDAELPEDTIPANDQPANLNKEGMVGPVKGLQTHLDNIIDTITKLAPDGPIRVVDGVQQLRPLNAATKGISDMLVHASNLGDGAGLVDALERHGLTAGQLQVLKNSAAQANDTLLRKIAKVTRDARTAGSKAEAQALRQTVDQLEATRASVQHLDMELSTQSGRDLRMRQENLVTGDLRHASIDNLMQAGGISRKEAEAALLHHVQAREAELANRNELQALNRKIDIAQQQKDFTTLQQLNQQKETLLGRTVRPNDTGGLAYRVFNKAIRGVLEVMISNVFTPSTAIINMIPSYAKILTKPFLNFLTKGVLHPYAFQEMVASYTAMHSMTGTAFKAATLAFKYERALLLQNSERSFLSHGVIPKKFAGGVFRFLPRVLNAQDEFMSQIAYRSWAAGRATVSALADADTKGLTGAARDRFIKDSVKDITGRLYSSDPEANPHVIDMLMDEAQNRGLGGQKANDWVRNQLNRNAKYLKAAQSDAGKDYVKDLLFKREFSGGKHADPALAAASRLAKGYEQFVDRNPIMKIAGQLFFRTPVRVFEEGLRITPGLNLITPGYMADLIGKNGTARQVRAQGEALMAYGLGGTVMGLYASGNITGGGPMNYREERAGEDTPDWQPYSIKLPNGDWWSYRNFDPIATPLKIMVNAMDRISVLQYREKQGEMSNQGELDKAIAYMGAGLGAVGQAIHDANLAQGLDNALKFYEDFTDQKQQNGSQGDQIIKALGGFVATAIPSTWTKAREAWGGPAFMDDPITFEQVLRAKINPQDPLVPKQYTATGRPRLLSDPAAAVYVFSASTPEMRERGVPQQEQEVDRDLWLTAQAADTDFTAPYKTPLLPSISDLRKAYTRDGQETYYDRWQRYIREGGIVGALHNIATSEIPYGAPGSSLRAAAYNKVLNAYRRAAMVRLMQEEAPGFGDLVQSKVQKAQQSLGNNTNVPFN